MRITFDMAYEILEILGSSDDPIEFNGRETSISDLYYNDGYHNDSKIDFNTDSRRINIMFYGTSSKGSRRRRGTLFTMIADRLGIPVPSKNRVTTKRAIKQRATTSVKKGRTRDSLGRFVPKGKSIPKVQNAATLARHILTSTSN